MPASRWRPTCWGGNTSPSIVALPCGLASAAVTLPIGIALPIYAAKAASISGRGTNDRNLSGGLLNPKYEVRRLRQVGPELYRAGLRRYHRRGGTPPRR